MASVLTIAGTVVNRFNAHVLINRLTHSLDGPDEMEFAELNATSDIHRLYDIWLRTRDEWVEKKLKQAGLLVDPGCKVIQ